MLLPPFSFRLKKNKVAFTHKYSLRKRREKSAERKVSMRQTCSILSCPIVLLMVIQNDSDATTKENTIAIYPAEDTADIQGKKNLDYISSLGATAI
jgi:hypothetical protein